LADLVVKIIHGNLYDMSKVMLHIENAFDRLESPYHPTAHQVMS